MTLRRQLLFMLADGCCVVFSAICFCIGKGRANCFNNLKYAEIIELFCFYCSLSSQRASWMCPFFTQVSVWLSNFYQGACALSKKYIIVMVRR
jgi:hypothetical protein